MPLRVHTVHLKKFFFLFYLTFLIVKLLVFFVVTCCWYGSQKILQRKLDAKFAFLKCKMSIQSEVTQQVVWKNEKWNLRWKISCILPAFSVCPSRDAIINRPVRHLSAVETGSANMRWFQFNKDLFLKCVCVRQHLPTSTAVREAWCVSLCTREGLLHRSTCSGLLGGLWKQQIEEGNNET